VTPDPKKRSSESDFDSGGAFHFDRPVRLCCSSAVDTAPFFSIFIDESSQTDHRFLVLGALILPQAELPAFVDALGRARLPELPAAEMKWGKVSKSKLEAYERFVRVFFRTPGAHFHSLVVDATQHRPAKFNRGDRETGFNKEIYQLVMKCGRLYRIPLFHVYPDQRSTSQSLEELRTIINRGMHKHFGWSRLWPVRRLQFQDSRILLTLQLADIFTGAIGFHLNGHVHKREASPAKRLLASQIFELANIRTPTTDTGISGKFTIWHRVLKGSGVP
jgi:hypothetical protein